MPQIQHCRAGRCLHHVVCRNMVVHHSDVHLVLPKSHYHRIVRFALALDMERHPLFSVDREQAVDFTQCNSAVTRRYELLGVEHGDLVARPERRAEYLVYQRYLQMRAVVREGLERAVERLVLWHIVRSRSCHRSMVSLSIYTLLYRTDGHKKQPRSHLSRRPPCVGGARTRRTDRRLY